MAITTKVIGIRYGVRTPEHEDGPGTDGFAVLQEANGTRHGVILFHDAVGTEMLAMIFNRPGEPVFAHELFVELLKYTGTTIEALSFTYDEYSKRRPGTVTLRNAAGTLTRECSAFDIVGFSIVTGVPIMIEDALFADMHNASPDLHWIMHGSVDESLSSIERKALSDDITKSRMH